MDFPGKQSGLAIPIETFPGLSGKNGATGGRRAEEDRP